jgi:hypothetical protein
MSGVGESHYLGMRLSHPLAGEHKHAGLEILKSEGINVVRILAGLCAG